MRFPRLGSFRRRRLLILLVLVALSAFVPGQGPNLHGAEVLAASDPVVGSDAVQSFPQVLLANQLLLCFLILAVGMGLGAIRLGGISLGTSGVLFAALLLGHWGTNAGWSLPDKIGSLGLVLFVYTVGLGSGTTFFRTFRQQGKGLALLGIVTVAGAAVATWALAWLLDIPGELATGVFAGSLTSTPALASAIETATTTGRNSLAVSIGYGMAYPLGVVGVVLYAQLLPKLLRVSLDELDGKVKAAGRESGGIVRRLVRISNPAIIDRSIREVGELAHVKAQIPRVLDGERLVPMKPDHVFQDGQVVLLVTDEDNADLLTALLGKPTEVPFFVDSGHDRAEIVLSNSELLGRPLRELHLRSRFGVTISRIERFEVPFVPSGDTTLNAGDRITAVGPPDQLRLFAKEAGHRTRKLHETDLMSLALCLAVGILVGMIPIQLPGLPEFSLGMAGGPLLVGLLVAHFGQFLGNTAYMPAAARMLTQELGLALFLADAGFLAGGSFMDTIKMYGAAPFLLSFIVIVVSLSLAYSFARFALGMNLLQILGGTCGAMTSTAGVGALSGATDSAIPVASYAAAYPASLVMMIVFAQILIAICQ
jgi:putative transport protein